jgi:hypothetical protein
MLRSLAIPHDSAGNPSVRGPVYLFAASEQRLTLFGFGPDGPIVIFDGATSAVFSRFETLHRFDLQLHAFLAVVRVVICAGIGIPKYLPIKRFVFAQKIRHGRCFLGLSFADHPQLCRTP